nr:MAG TPA: hypothetical protein [Caudoviricetes sp.]
MSISSGKLKRSRSPQFNSTSTIPSTMGKRYSNFLSRSSFYRNISTNHQSLPN